MNQREVGTDTLSFADGLRHIFRQNPDVIVIGELRDYESISIALTAAETGHLVLGHAPLHERHGGRGPDHRLLSRRTSSRRSARSWPNACSWSFPSGS